MEKVQFRDLPIKHKLYELQNMTSYAEQFLWSIWRGSIPVKEKCDTDIEIVDSFSTYIIGLSSVCLDNLRQCFVHHESLGFLHIFLYCDDGFMIYIRV